MALRIGVAYCSEDRPAAKRAARTDGPSAELYEPALRTTGALPELTLLARHWATQFATIAFQVRSAMTTEPIAFG